MPARKLSPEIWQQETACIFYLLIILIIIKITTAIIINFAELTIIIYGLSVHIGAKEYYCLTKHVDVKLPVKWMAPETLSDYNVMFSEMSDVVYKWLN